MANIRIAISALAIYDQLAAAAVPSLVAAYRPFGINLVIEKGVQLASDPVTPVAWQQLVLQLAKRSASVSPAAPAHVIFATMPPGYDLSINGQLLNETRGLCALYLGAGSFQTPSPFKRLDLVAQVLIHEVGHMLNLTHGDSYGYKHSDAMMPTLERLQQAPLPAWQVAVADAASRQEVPLQIPSPTYYYPFGAQCRACLRDAETNPQWWPWRTRFRDEFNSAGAQSDFSLSVAIDAPSLPAAVTVGDGVCFTLRVRNDGSQPVPVPMHIGPEFGTMTVAVEAHGTEPVFFKPDNYRCSSGKTVVLPGETLLRSFSLVPSPDGPLFSVAGPHVLRVQLFSTESGSRLLLGAAAASIVVVEGAAETSGANRVAAQLVASVRGHHSLPAQVDFDKLNALVKSSTIAQHARYKLALLHSGEEKTRLLRQCLRASVPTAIRHRAARQLAMQLLQSGWKFPKVLSSMRRYHLDERDEELFETLKRMGQGWNALNG